MIDLENLLVYLSGGPCIAWIGAGPSIEMGSKSWKSLASSLLEEARKNKKADFSKIEDYYKIKRYPQLFGEIKRQYGYDYLVNQLRDKLEEKKSEGDLYKAIAKLPFVGYFTTNFDDLLVRHISTKKVWKIYQNDRDSISSIDVHSIPSVVKLHGSLDEGLEDTLIVTDEQYNRWYYNGEKEYFQTFLTSHLHLDRIVFIGYSMNDPEIIHIIKRITENIRRKTPAIAILANVSDIELDMWKRDYNISVIRYAAVNDNHSELSFILNTAARFIDDSSRIPTISKEESKLAQKFYFWHKFEQKEDAKAKIDALKSVLLSTANELGDGYFKCETIAEALKDMVKTEKEKLLQHIYKCCDELVSEGWLISNKEGFKLATETKELIDSYNRQYDDLINTFIKQVQLDLKGKTGIMSEELLGRAATKVFEILTEIFNIRGAEIINLAFSDKPVPIKGSNDILSVIWSNASQIGDASLEFAITNYIIDTLTKPEGIVEQVVDYLSKAFFSMQALRINAGDEDLINEYYRNQAFLIDENVLIPLIASGEPRHDLCVNTVKAAVEKGILLFTTEDAAYEIFKHGNWASELISRYGEQSSEVMKASRGEGEYSSNAFLNGYIVESQKHNVPYSFIEYLTECVGDGFSEYQIWQKLNSLGIKKLKRSAKKLNSDVSKLNQDIQLSIASDVAERQLDKSSGRIEREAYAYSIIYYWAEFSKLFKQSHRPQCSFLTFSTALAGVASHGPHPIRRSILASPQALYELIIRYLKQSEKEINIGSVLRSSYFRTVGQFIDKEKYATFFAPLIAESHKMYSEHYELYRKYVEEKLTKGVINEYEPLDIVDFVSSLEIKLQAMPKNMTKENKEMKEEINKLKKQLQEMKDKERKRKEYVKKQRTKAKIKEIRTNK